MRSSCWWFFLREQPHVRGGEAGDPEQILLHPWMPMRYWLTYMREEEKLARDVYLHQNSLWNMQVFSRIAASEQRHMDAVKNLLDGNGLPDPAAGKSQGEYSSPRLHALYNSLTEQGRISRIEAIRTGIIVEETDIADLKIAISTAKHRDIRNLYNYLFAGSFPHLCAFRHTLAWY